MNEPAPPRPRSLLKIIGPALIVASVVLGPGSILTASKVGTGFGYGMLWVLAFAAVLMIANVALAARLGAALPHSIGDELANRLGRPFSIFIGVTVFTIIACFQSSNNLAILAAMEPWTGALDTVASIGVLLGINGAILGFLFGSRKLYTSVERMMATLVAVMLVAFAVNLFAAKPSISQSLGGLVPRRPDGDSGAMLSILGLFATTFSIAGAFYQAYLVREKGWTIDDAKRGLVDNIAGIAVLGGITGMIMITAAAVLHGKIDPGELKSVADLARQLQPLFGDWAGALFAAGLFAGAFSSFLVNAMIGGTVLSDGLGRGAKLDDAWPRRLTAAALLAGAAGAMAFRAMGRDPVQLIVIAQACTVFGGPILAGSLLYLATRRDRFDKTTMPRWILALTAVGFLATLILACRTAWSLWQKAAG